MCTGDCDGRPGTRRAGAAPGWPDAADLDAEQDRLAALRPPHWQPEPGPLAAGGCFLAFARGQQGPGHPGDRGWAGAALVEEPGHHLRVAVAVPVRAGATYQPGRLALREGPALAAALAALGARPDVVLVDATGRDHPRRAGLALHLGAALDVPTVGVTHRPLRAAGDEPGAEAGAWTPLLLDGDVVGAWMRTRPGARPVAVHAAWRTDVATAVDVVRRCSGRARTPEPLRQARVAARRARAEAEGRAAAT
ncbi:MAG TPA: endonuclease V [Acidimicrobiia bacterium]